MKQDEGSNLMEVANSNFKEPVRLERGNLANADHFELCDPEAMVDGMRC